MSAQDELDIYVPWQMGHICPISRQRVKGICGYNSLKKLKKNYPQFRQKNFRKKK